MRAMPMNKTVAWANASLIFWEFLNLNRSQETRQLHSSTWTPFIWHIQTQLTQAEVAGIDNLCVPHSKASGKHLKLFLESFGLKGGLFCENGGWLTTCIVGQAEAAELCVHIKERFLETKLTSVAPYCRSQISVSLIPYSWARGTLAE